MRDCLPDVKKGRDAKDEKAPLVGADRESTHEAADDDNPSHEAGSEDIRQREAGSKEDEQQQKGESDEPLDVPNVEYLACECISARKLCPDRSCRLCQRL